MTLTWTEVQTRIERGRAALEAGQYEIERLTLPTAKASYAVRNGESVAGDPYTVAFYEDRPTGNCSCPDYVNRGGPACKHTAMAVLHEWPQQFERWQERVKALCQAEPAAAEEAPPDDVAEEPTEPAAEPAAQSTPTTEPEEEGPVTVLLSEEEVRAMVEAAVASAMRTMEQQLVSTVCRQVVGRIRVPQPPLRGKLFKT